MEIRPTHARIAPDAHAGARKSLVRTQTATFRAPFAIGHLEEGDTRQFVHLPECDARYIEGANQMHPFAHISLFENTPGIGTQLADGVPDARLARLAEPRSGRGQGIGAGKTRRVGDTVARFMYGYTATITFNNLIDTVTLVPQTAATNEQLSVDIIKLKISIFF